MHPVRDTLTTTANPLVLVALTWALLWGYGASQVPMTLDHPGAHADRAAGAASGFASESVWDESWSERYPGCVALALWPTDEKPVALVVRAVGGGVARVSPAAVQAPGRVVGACR